MNLDMGQAKKAFYDEKGDDFGFQHWLADNGYEPADIFEGEPVLAEDPQDLVTWFLDEHADYESHENNLLDIAINLSPLSNFHYQQALRIAAVHTAAADLADFFSFVGDNPERWLRHRVAKELFSILSKLEPRPIRLKTWCRAREGRWENVECILRTAPTRADSDGRAHRIGDLTPVYLASDDQTASIEALQGQSGEASVVGVSVALDRVIDLSSGPSLVNAAECDHDRIVYLLAASFCRDKGLGVQISDLAYLLGIEGIVWSSVRVPFNCHGQCLVVFPDFSEQIQPVDEIRSHTYLSQHQSDRLNATDDIT